MFAFLWQWRWRILPAGHPHSEGPTEWYINGRECVVGHWWRGCDWERTRSAGVPDESHETALHELFQQGKPWRNKWQLSLFLLAFQHTIWSLAKTCCSSAAKLIICVWIFLFADKLIKTQHQKNHFCNVMLMSSSLLESFFVLFLFFFGGGWGGS